jgi:DNA-binding IclR family transcriptional regulator
VTEEALLGFISSDFRSVWPLELLLLLRQEPVRAWPVDELVRELRASSAALTEALAALRRNGLASVDQQGAYRFEASSAETAELARELIDLYNRKPRAVMRAITSVPNERIRTFADAFRIRKDPD